MLAVPDCRSHCARRPGDRGRHRHERGVRRRRGSPRALRRRHRVTPARRTMRIATRSSSPACRRVIEGQDLATRLSTEIARADLKLRPAEFLFAWIASPFVFVVLRLRSSGSSSPASTTWSRSPRSFAIGAYFPRWYIGFRQRKRLRSLQRAAAQHHHPARQLAPRRLVVPAGRGAGDARGAAAHLRGVRARRARDEPGRGAPAGARQSRAPREVRGPRADGHRHQHPEPGRWQPRHRPRLDRLHHPRADPDRR